MSRSVVVFADSRVGYFCVKWLIENYREDLSCVVTTSVNNIYHIATENDAPSASKDDAFLSKSLGGLMEQFNDCLQPCCSS